MPEWHEVWRAGNYPQGNFTENDVQQIVDNYIPEESEAPVVIGHPKNEDPAFGWVEALKREGGKLLAKFKQVVPEFAEAVNQGRYKKVSVRLRKKENGWNLIHVGFLGAAKPQVEGLKPISFSEEDAAEGVDVECDFNQKEEKKVPPLDEKKLREDIRKELEAEFSADQDKLKKDLEAANRKLKLSELGSFISENKTKIPPATRAGLAEFMATLEDGEQMVEFTAKEKDKDKEVKQSPLEFFKDFVAKLPDYSPLFKETDQEEDATNRKHREDKEFTDTQVDEERLALHRKALDFAEKNKVTYEEALVAVGD
ncbi:hypothetical protein [Pelotomaculum propionicicum]|uniref:Peptidase n=1 Tax=Pelotomaculum propionicicum TaxID=258475 RepID=A0A4Y7RK74_9FIRM|nr:hypothetical protein [Pelotomaculum propionicicum]TEB09150.1 hypothetical protein Pmgp_03371 [Pelotomaculum propionicicum]